MARILAWLSMGAWVVLLWPFPATSFLAVCAAFASYPILQLARKKLPQQLAIPAYTLSLTCIVLLPMTVLVLLIIPQVVAGLKLLEGLRDTSWLQSPRAQELLSSVDVWLKQIPGLEGGLEQITSYVVGMVGSIGRSILASGMGLAGGTLQFLMSLLLFIMIAAFCAIQARFILNFVCRLCPLPRPVINRFISTIRNAILGVITGVILVALIQGFLCGVGFTFAGVPQPAFWGLLAAMVAPIPFVGTALVWLPACLWLLLTGKTMICLGLLLWCAILVSGVDSVMRPFFLRTRIDASVLALLLSIFCGLSAFGPVGIFAGPILLAVANQAARESMGQALRTIVLQRDQKNL